ncbi:MAG: alpha/beta hydrolase-fold protein [Chloroflexota bacterium]
MITRQAFITLIGFSLLAGLWGCTPSNERIPTPTALPSTPTETPSPTPIPPTPTITPLTCLTQPGQVKAESLTSTKPAQEFRIYLPPCYDQMTELEYPVLYLLHGQTFQDDQWVRLGAATIADQLIISGEAPPFIIVFPDDRYWNLPAGPGFGDRLLELIIPYVDENYRTQADRDHRAIGGLSRGGGWAARLGFWYPELFGAIGLHSPFVFGTEQEALERRIAEMPPDTRPRLWIDVGDADTNLTYCRSLAAMLTDHDYLHEFHVYAGDHTEGYWSRHTEEYLRWYIEGWVEQESQP